MDSLVLRAMDGDGEAFAELIRQNKESMYKAAWIFLRNDQDVADAIQETILTSYEKLFTLKNPAYFRTWLLRILKNKCMDLLRATRGVESYDSLPDIAGEKEPEYDKLEWKSLLSCLDSVSAEILELHYFDGLTAAEIAEVMELNRNTVLTRLKRGRAKLRQILAAG